MKRRAEAPGDVVRGIARFAREVLDLVAAIPLGRVMSYGAISAYLDGSGPRSVAKVMSSLGDEVPWWRVLRADGSCAPEVEARQLRLLRREGVVFRTPRRVDMAASGHVPPE